jgi:hypothetical protein
MIGSTRKPPWHPTAARFYLLSRVRECTGPTRECVCMHACWAIFAPPHAFIYFHASVNALGLLVSACACMHAGPYSLACTPAWFIAGWATIQITAPYYSYAYYVTVFLYFQIY